VGATEDEDLEAVDGKQTLQEGPIRYYDKRQQLELVLAAQELSGLGNREVDPTGSREEEDYGVETKDTDIWKDATCLALLEEGMLPYTIELEEGKRARKRANNYCWKEQRLYFKELYVPKLEERIPLVVHMHEDLGHSGGQRMLAEICRRYFWHNRIEDVKSVVRSCQQCQLVRSEGNIRSGDEQLKSIPIYDLFHRVALDTAGPLPETKSGTNTSWWPSTIILSGVRQGRLLITVPRLQPGSWKMTLSASMESPSLYLLTMVENGLQNSR
jgi:hypothetical protein